MSLADGPLIDEKRTTLASMLRSNGYQTSMVGKWHLGFKPFLQDKKQEPDYSAALTGGPIDRGFDSFFGMHASLDLPPYFYIRGRAPVQLPKTTIRANDSLGSDENWNRIQGAFWREGRISEDFDFDQVTPRFFSEAVNVIESHTAAGQTKPLFLYLALPSPHTPWLPLPQYRGKSGAGMYGDFVLQVDAGVGRVIQALEKAGIEQNTLLLFSSDNGPVWYDKDIERFHHRAVGQLRGMKFASWEGGHRMPFLTSWPARIPANSTSHRTVAFADVFATLASIVGADDLPVGTAEDSISFLPWLLNPASPPEVRPSIIHDSRTIRNGRWKLIMPKTNRKNQQTLEPELYDLKNDLSETNNLYDAESDLAKRLEQELTEFLSSM